MRKPRGSIEPQGKYAISNDITFSETIRDEIHPSLEEPARRGTQRMLAAALQAEVDECIQRCGSERDGNIHALVALVAIGVKSPNGETRILPNMPSYSVVDLQVDVAIDSAPRSI